MLARRHDVFLHIHILRVLDLMENGNAISVDSGLVGQEKAREVGLERCIS